MLITFDDGRVIRGELRGNGGPCLTVARASDVLRWRRRSGEGVIVYPYEKRTAPWPENVERHNPDRIVRLEAETPAEAASGRRREPRALAVWCREDDPEDDAPARRADWSRALPTVGW